MKIRGVPVRHVTDPAPAERVFRFANGATAASLREFHERLAEVSVETVGYHREHYAAWVRDVLGDEPLALRIETYAQTKPAPATLRDILRDLVGSRLDALLAAQADSSSP